MFKRHVEQDGMFITRITILEHIDFFINWGTHIFIQESVGPFRLCSSVIPNSDSTGVNIEFEDGESATFDFEHYNETWQFGFCI